MYFWKVQRWLGFQLHVDRRKSQENLSFGPKVIEGGGGGTDTLIVGHHVVSLASRLFPVLLTILQYDTI